MRDIVCENGVVTIDGVRIDGPGVVAHYQGLSHWLPAAEWEEVPQPNPAYVLRLRRIVDGIHVDLRDSVEIGRVTVEGDSLVYRRPS